MSSARVDVLEPGPVDAAARFGWRHNRWLRGLTAVLAGAVSGLAWQPYGLWPLLLIGVPALTLLVRDGDTTRPRRSAFGVGYLYGLGLLGVSISWIHVLGNWVALLLIAFEALFLGLLGLLLHLTSALRWWPLAAALCWSLIEFLYSRVPFGGFGWVRLAYAAVDTPLAGFLPLIGVAGVSFLVAVVAQTVAYAVGLTLRRTAGLTRRLIPLGVGVLVLVLLGVGVRAVPSAPRPPTDRCGSGSCRATCPARGSRRSAEPARSPTTTSARP